MDSTLSSPPSINVHILDGQHATLIERIERLEQALAAGESGAELAKIIWEITDYANYHGPAEERLMASYGYPLRDLHAVEHHRFFQRLHEIERMVVEGHSTAAVQALNRLRGWLERHIVEWDAKLGDFLNSCGVA